MIWSFNDNKLCEKNKLISVVSRQSSFCRSNLLDVELKTFADDAGDVVDSPDICIGGGP